MKDYALIETIANNNRKAVARADGDQNYAEGLVTFGYEEFSIYDPFMDETGRFEVDPYEYYGADNMKKLILGTGITIKEHQEDTKMGAFTTTLTQDLEIIPECKVYAHGNKYFYFETDEGMYDDNYGGLIYHFRLDIRDGKVFDAYNSSSDTYCIHEPCIIPFDLDALHIKFEQLDAHGLIPDCTQEALEEFDEED